LVFLKPNKTTTILQNWIDSLYSIAILNQLWKKTSPPTPFDKLRTGLSYKERGAG
jgi:hypothetical protein